MSRRKWQFAVSDEALLAIILNGGFAGFVGLFWFAYATGVIQ